MSKSFHLCRHGLWLAIFLFSLLGSTQKCSAQFGLFDTVWTMNGNSLLCKSSNDSLLFLYGSKDSSIYIVKTLNPIDTVWWSSTYPLSNSPRKFLNNDTEILFDTWDRANKTHYYKVVNKETFETIDSVFYNWSSYPYSECLMYRMGISEIDTSIYYAGYCGATAIKGISYKVNYRTGQTTITSDSLPYFAMTISEDGQYVAGVYYTGGDFVNVPINEVIEVRNISDYSLVFREESKYSDYDPNFYPYSWVTNYKLKFTKNNHYLVLTKDKIYIYDLIIGQKIFEKATIAKQSTFSNNNILFFLTRIIDDDKSEKIKACTFDCENDIYLERDFPDSTNQLIFHSDDLVFNNDYVLCHMLNKYNKSTNYYSGFADVALLSLNFDLTSINESENPIQGTLYPNPASDYIEVSVGANGHLPLQEIKIYDVFGNCVLSVETRHALSLQRIDVSTLPAGVYFLRIGNEKPLKFVVVR